jgi:glycosyltransferase involved in cell wall biosynthesis
VDSHPTESLTVIAIMTVRNEAAIIASSVGHLLENVGVDRVIVADNESTDETLAILNRIAAADDRIQVESTPGDFKQSDMMTRLFHLARDRGADWVLPSDADEFLWLGRRDIHAVCAAAGKVGGFDFPVVNFAQRSRVLVDADGVLETMTFSARPTGTMAEARALVMDGRISFLQMRYPVKVMLRAVEGLVLHPGQHGANGADGPIVALSGAEVLHAPMRARSALESRIEYARRVDEPDPDINWHLKRLVPMGEAGLEQEWRRNSVNLRTLGGGWLRHDRRLRRISRRLRRFRATALTATRS